MDKIVFGVIIGCILGLLVAFAIVLTYRKGVIDGKKMAENKPLEGAIIKSKHIKEMDKQKIERDKRFNEYTSYLDRIQGEAYK